MKFRSGPGWAYLALAIGIMAPLFVPGYLLLLDSPWTPYLPLPQSVDSSYAFFAALHWLSLVVPSQLIQKLLLLGILWLAGWGMHKLVRQVTTVGVLPAYFAGLIYVVNPFVYSRLMAGQYLVVFGYALVPWFVAALWRYLPQPTWRRALSVALWALAVSTVSIHSILFIALLSVVSLIAFISSRRGRIAWKPLLLTASAAVALWLAASAFWIIPTLTGHGSTAQLVGHFDARYAEAFKTIGDRQYGIVFNAASLYGFWLDPRGFYILPKARVPLWPVLSGVILALSATGLVAWRRRYEAWVVAVVAAVALVLGIGIAYGPFAGIYNWCVTYIPLFRGYREPQKFIGLLVLAYAFLGAIGAEAMLGYLRRTFPKGGSSIARTIVPFLLLVLPLAYTPLMLWGFGGQIKPTNYPADWYALDRRLAADHDHWQSLFLPWHQYSSFSFTTNIIANPAQAFFAGPVIQGNNLELGSIYSQESSPQSDLVQDRVLRQRATIIQTGNALAPIGVKYVILAKNFDAKDYAWLDRQTDLRLISDTQNLKVYLNTAWRAEATRP